MLTRILIFSIAVLMLASCQKNKGDLESFHLSAKINGVKTDFNVSVFAQKTGDDLSGYNIYIFGSGGTSVNLLPTFDLNIDDDVAIVPKTYQTIQSQNIWKANCSYWVDGSTRYDSDGTDFTITITSIDNNEVKGTFSGVLEDRSTGLTKTITEGTFLAKIQ